MTKYIFTLLLTLLVGSVFAQGIPSQIDTFQLWKVEKKSSFSTSVQSYTGISQHNEPFSLTTFGGKYHFAVISASGDVVLVNSEEGKHVVDSTNLNYDCGVVDVGLPHTDYEYTPTKQISTDTRCVDVFIEVDNDVFEDKGADTEYFTLAQYDQVALLYSTINVDINVSEITINESPLVYVGTSVSTFLSILGSRWTTFNGNIAMLNTYKGSGGVAWLTQNCTDLPYGVASINNTFLPAPTYSWSIMVQAHEIGHLLGSHHTQACVWNGNNTAIDGCWSVEGSCPNPGVPVNGGGVMSYCHLNSVGINFNAPFAGEPGQRIYAYTGQSCFTTCDTVTPPPPNDTTTVDTFCTLVYLDVLLDDYPSDVFYQVYTSDSLIYDSPNFYRLDRNSRMKDTLCLNAGCYNFRIMDAQGDGLSGSCNVGEFSVSGEDTLYVEDVLYETSYNTTFCVDTIVNPPVDTGVVDNCTEYLDLTPDYVYRQQGYGIFNNKVVLTGHNYVVIEGGYTFTENTVLSINFRSAVEGTCQGIGFGNTFPPAINLPLYGTGDCGLNWIDIYEPEYGWLSLNAPVGSYMSDSDYLQDTVVYTKMYLFNYVESFPFNAQSEFKNIRLCEEGNLATLQISAELGGLWEVGETPEEVYINILGQQVTPSIEGVYFKRGADGTYEKVYFTPE